MSIIQSVLFNKDYYSLNEAKKIIRSNKKLKLIKYDITHKFYRFRQMEPNYKKYYYRTKELPNNIKLIIGFKKNVDE